MYMYTVPVANLTYSKQLLRPLHHKHRLSRKSLSKFPAQIRPEFWL